MTMDQRRGGHGARLWAGRLDPALQEAARFHRELDRPRLRAMAMSVVCAALAMLGVLGIVGLKVHQVRLSYRLDALRVARAEADETTRRLRVELATLTSLARIEDRARAELGMVPPGKDQVRLAREFVQGGTGLSSLRLPRTASTPRVGPAWTLLD